MLSDTTPYFELSWILSRYNRADIEVANNAVLAYFYTLSLKSDRFLLLLDYLILKRVREATKTILEFLEEFDASTDEIDLFGRLFHRLAEKVPASTWWESYTTIFQNNPEHRAEILNWLISLRLHEPYINELSDNQLAWLYEQAISEFRYADDVKPPRGVHQLGDREEQQLWRERLLSALVARGSDYGLKHILQLSELDHSPPFIDRVKNSAVNAFCAESWKPPIPDDLFSLLENNDLRVIQTERQLLDLVIQTLDSLAKDYKTTTWMQRALWDQQSGSQSGFKPIHDETHFSNVLGEWLGDRLKHVILNREVQIHHPITKKRGNSADIVIQTTNTIDKILTVIVEVKCLLV